MLSSLLNTYSHVLCILQQQQQLLRFNLRDEKKWRKFENREEKQRIKQISEEKKKKDAAMKLRRKQIVKILRIVGKIWRVEKRKN